MSALHAQLQMSRDDFRLNIDLKAPLNGITALFGPSGAGKTTLLRAIAGLDRASGSLRVGDDVWQDSTRFLPTHERAVGMVFQESSLFDHLDVAGNLDYGLKRARGKTLDRSEVIELLDLGALLGRRTAALSGGERKRVAIGRALLRNPQLLLMDEPLASLDVERKRELLPFLERLRAELQIPVLYVSHAPDEVARLADELVLMENGTVTASGPINETLTRLDLPIAHEHDAGAVVSATASDYDEQFDLSTLNFGGGELLVAGRLPTGTAVRARVLARDISLTLERQPGTSILNILPAVVLEISDDCSAQALVRLDAGGTILLARITRKSSQALGISIGKRVFAQIKSIAILDT